MRYGDPAEAHEIVQGLLDKVDLAYRTGDFGVFANIMHTPHHIRNKAEAFHIRDLDGLKLAFDTFLAYTNDLGAVDCKRNCIEAKFKTRDSIQALHDVTYFNEAGEKVRPTTQTKCVVMAMGIDWKICGSDNTGDVATGVADAVQTKLLQRSGTA